MAVTIRGTPGTDGAGSTATATSRTPAITSGTLPGELMIAACSWGSSNGTITLSTPPSGWTLLHNTNQTSAELAVYYRYFQAGDANPAFVLSGATPCVATCTTFSGAVTSGAPVDAALAGGAASTTVTYPAITPANATDLLVYIIEMRPTTAAAAPSLSTLPAGGTGGTVTNLGTNATNVAGVAEHSVTMLTQQLTAATAIGSETSTAAQSGSCVVEAVCIAAAPAGGAPPAVVVPQAAVMQAACW